MKKSYKKLLTTTLTIIAGASLATACNQLQSNDPIIRGEQRQKSEYLSILSTQAVSSMQTILDEETSNNPKEENPSETTSDTSTPTTPSNQEIPSTLEEIINQGQVVVYEKLNFEVSESDLKDYNYLLTISHNDEIYKMYFKSLREKIDKEKDEEEYTFTYEGTLIYQENEFKFFAKEEVEIENDEEESEIEFKVLINDEESLVIKQEREIELNIEENEFTYEHYKNGKLVKSYKLEKEYNESGLVIKCEVNGYVFKIKYDETNKKVVIKFNNQEVLFEYNKDNIEINPELKAFILELKEKLENLPIFNKNEDDD